MNTALFKSVLLLSSLFILLSAPSVTSFQLTGLEQQILKSLVRMRHLRVKLVEYFHESLSVPILSFLVSDHKMHPADFLLGGRDKARMDRRVDDQEDVNGSTPGGEGSGQMEIELAPSEDDGQRAATEDLKVKNLVVQFHLNQQKRRPRSVRRALDY